MRRALVCLLMVAVPVGSAVLPAGTAGATVRLDAGESPTCAAAIDVWWPVQSRAWAKRVAARESGYLNARAKNPKSSAVGCMQLLHSLHAWRYDRVGFGCNRWRWRNTDCSILAARHLFLQAGTRPWAVTRYTR
jgi:hypothetical protein